MTQWEPKVSKSRTKFYGTTTKKLPIPISESATIKPTGTQLPTKKRLNWEDTGVPSPKSKKKTDYIHTQHGLCINEYEQCYSIASSNEAQVPINVSNYKTNNVSNNEIVPNQTGNVKNVSSHTGNVKMCQVKQAM